MEPESSLPYSQAPATIKFVKIAITPIQRKLCEPHVTYNILDYGRMVQSLTF
jgi:hypothetical protein